jgi:3-deoxy-D-manno-octulosonic acid hydroxylase-like protein
MLRPVPYGAWGGDSPAVDVTADLESGAVLFFQKLAFDVRSNERAYFSPEIAVAKNVSFDPVTGRLGGVAHADDTLTAMLRRFSESAAALAGALFPQYEGRLQRARASFRPAEIAGRQTTWRHDDTRLHVDSFPATPVQGRRILRVFTNVNPDGRPRSWRIGEPFELVATRFGSRLKAPMPFSASLLRLARITKSHRSAYDALMLQLHDRMKADTAYQASAAQEAVHFPAGSTWMAFTDSVSHAAMAGQYQLEQTFLLPVEAMRQPERSPLRVLERIKGRPLV